MSTEIKSWSTTISVMIAAMTILSASAFSQNFSPDHYVSYALRTGSTEVRTMSLRDQFGDWTDFAVEGPTKLLNPAVKEDETGKSGIKDFRLHYAAYPVTPVDTSMQFATRVSVTNALGEFQFDTLIPDRLLVPTRKINLSPQEGDLGMLEVLPDAEHYFCYEIPLARAAGAGELTDQFRTRPYDGLIARRFCVPVAKSFGDDVTDIIDNSPSNTLTCFSLQKMSIFKEVALVNALDLIYSARVVSDDELCIPSVSQIIPVLCGETAPDGNGVCNGACPIGDVCQPGADGTTCSCFTPEPQCGDTAPDNGVCNGSCPNADDVCQPSVDGASCSCVPPLALCGDTDPENGVCNGACPNANEVCGIIDDTFCACVIPLDQCGDTDPDNGVCNGECPNADEVCQLNTDGTACSCAVPVALCGDTDPDNGICNGACLNADEVCEPNVDGTLCSCAVPLAQCGDTDPNNGICNGACPNVDEVCEPNADGTFCSCAIPVELCGDTDPVNGVCNGACQNVDEVCKASADGSDCACVPPLLLCVDASPDGEEQCNGVCPPNEICSVTATGDACICQPTVTLCGFTPDGECGGACLDPNQLCIETPDTNECVCVQA